MYRPRALAISHALALLVVSTLPSEASAQTAAPRPEYRAIEEDSSTGTRIRHREIGRSQIAMNVDYEALPVRDRQLLHGWWERIPEGDEPPFPIGGLRAYFDPLRVVAERLQVQGQLFVVGTVGPDGRVRRAEVYASLTKEFGEIAAKGLMLTRFKPAKCSGAPCTMEFPFQVELVLRSR